jgi:hypothetical protein
MWQCLFKAMERLTREQFALLSERICLLCVYEPTEVTAYEVQYRREFPLFIQSQGLDCGEVVVLDGDYDLYA